MNDLVIKYDIAFEVTKMQYYAIIEKYHGCVAHRKDENNQYFIKLWVTKFADDIMVIIASN
jgi:hypothetical protein